MVCRVVCESGAEGARIRSAELYSLCEMVSQWQAPSLV